MSRIRRNFSAKFKSELVIELLKGEKDLNTIASENNIQPNLLRNWKKEFLDKVFVCYRSIIQYYILPTIKGKTMDAVTGDDLLRILIW